MNTSTIPAEWLHMESSEAMTLLELSECCGMSASELDELVDYCALVPLTANPLARAFSSDLVAPLRIACKLRLDFDLDLFTVAVLLGNLTRIETLEREVLALKAMLRANLD